MYTLEELQEQHQEQMEARILVYRLDLIKIEQELSTAKPKEVPALLRRKAFNLEMIANLNTQKEYFNPFL